jgi:membrane-bound serine protease (ClpP class)
MTYRFRTLPPTTDRTIRRGALPRLRPRFLSGLLLGLVFWLGLPSPSAAQSTAGAPTVVVVPIEGMIDMGLAPYVRRVLADAEQAKAAAVVFEINTFGGRVDAAVQIRDAILGSPVQTVAFINRRAISAGALISLAAKRIVMTPGGTIGAAMPVQMTGGDKPSPVDEKSVSYVRKEFRATADARGRPPLVAEAMVDADVEIDGLVAKGKLLTLTTTEALQQRVADAEAASLEVALQQIGLAGATVQRDAPNWGERIVRLLTHPVVASLLLSLATLGILLELRTPGFGVPGLVGLASLALVLGGHWIVALVGWEELLLVSAGLVLLVLEVFVIPGFGLAGVAGIVSVLAGLSLTFVGQGATTAAIVDALGRVVLAMTLSLLVGLVLMRFLPRTRMGRQLVLETALDSDAGYVSAEPNAATLVGRTGRTRSSLRPAGIVEIDGERFDVVSDGELIEVGAPVVVARVDGSRIEVRRVPDLHTDTTT